MIRVIDGTRCNTDTAQMIYQQDNGLFVDDYHFRQETIYRTPKGRYFVHLAGGAGTPYSRRLEEGGQWDSVGGEWIYLVVPSKGAKALIDDAKKALGLHGDK